MTKEKFEALEKAYDEAIAQANKSVMHCGGKTTLLSGEEVEGLIKTPLERIKAMCQEAEFDCQEAEMMSKDKPELASYYRGRVTAFNSILSFISQMELEK